MSNEYIWQPFVNRIYPLLLNSVHHDLLHHLFVKAASFQLVPRLHSVKEADQIYQEVLGNKQKYFDRPIGVKCGVVKEDASAIEAIVGMGELAFVELGPVTIDPQHQPAIRTRLL